MFVHPPVCLYAPLYIHMPPYIYMPPGVHTPPRGPHASVLLHGFGTLHVVGELFSVLGHSTPIWGCLPLNYTPHTPLLVLCALLFSGISVLMWAFPLLLKGLGVFPHHWGRLGVAHQLFSCSHTHSVTLFCSALCLTSQPRLRLLLLQLQWYLLACHQCHQYQWLLL